MTRVFFFNENFSGRMSRMIMRELAASSPPSFSAACTKLLLLNVCEANQERCP